MADILGRSQFNCVDVYRCLKEWIPGFVPYPMEKSEEEKEKDKTEGKSGKRKKIKKRQAS